MFRIRLSDFNLMIGMGWDKPGNAFIRFVFDYNEADGAVATVTIKNWTVAFPLDDPWEGDGEVLFWLGDCRRLLQQIESHYTNMNAMLNFKIYKMRWELVGGPGNGEGINRVLS